MGLNAEMVQIAAEHRRQGDLSAGAVLEFGAQDLCASPEVVAHVLSSAGFEVPGTPIQTAREMYTVIGLTDHCSIDATGQDRAFVYDLNQDLGAVFGFRRQFDLVTNLGTAEHCFNQYQVFKNMHNTCRPGGLMIHAAPCAGNVNHGFYNYHPRFFADLAAANGYEILRLAFTVDYGPELIPYSQTAIRKHDDRDLLLYVVLRRIGAAEFRTPFDGMFSGENALPHYRPADADPLDTAFAPYLKGGSWAGTKGTALLPWWKRGLAARLLGHKAAS